MCVFFKFPLPALKAELTRYAAIHNDTEILANQKTLNEMSGKLFYFK